ncbi:GDSL-type esterase/lipase family protein [Fictibacillus phosphorivorans]|uniref:GDSL-type esterase/lipase family protein n=1 Tax=Fictibacillus phosphorivorans TaxID=1221500 RepID=UPI00204101B5|nr:GDSL-type esterase/lipase family protein [Fictibacillus phosphorivorans]MCM3719088.1 GDSL-type esterase/lipase family protein [Fictibacillus phosphorivorans]MCM3776710.1 GDSL-type esterase/lipase family protein [Fictibacillus phosphorivorans]
MKTLVCFGDSITSKEKSEDGSLRLTSRLRQELTEWVVMNAGIPAETTRAALVRLQDDVLRHHPDIVTILFGANDSSDHRLIPLKEYENNLTYMVNKIGAKKVILISPAPVFEEKQKARTNERMQTYAQTVKKVAKHEGTAYVPLFEILNEMEIEKFVIDDGLHFNQYGYEELSDLVLKTIKTLSTISFPKKQLSL